MGCPISNHPGNLNTVFYNGNRARMVKKLKLLCGGETDGLGAYGMVDQELLASRRTRSLPTNGVLEAAAQLKGRLGFNAERAALGEIGHRLGRKALAEVASVARPDTILAWYRKFIARKFDGSKARRSPGRPRISRAVEDLSDPLRKRRVTRWRRARSAARSRAKCRLSSPTIRGGVLRTWPWTRGVTFRLIT